MGGCSHLASLLVCMLAVAQASRHSPLRQEPAQGRSLLGKKSRTYTGVCVCVCALQLGLGIARVSELCVHHHGCLNAHLHHLLTLQMGHLYLCGPAR